MKRSLTLTMFALLAVLVLTGCTGETPQSGGGKLESMAAYPATLQMNKGDQTVIQVVLTPEDAEDTDLLWVSSNHSVVTVNDKGMVDAVGDGQCTVTAASKTNSEISCTVEVTVGDAAPASTQDPPQVADAPAAPANTASDYEQYIGYNRESNAASVYPAYALSESEASGMDSEELQFVINQIYAKNGYIFRTQSIQSYFSQMPWYTPVSSDAGQLSMSRLDRSNLNLLVRVRDSRGDRSGVSSVGWIWTRYAVDSSLSEGYVSGLSSYDIQLLINTIYAKNGYIFEDQQLQAMFSGQPWYRPVSHDTSSLSFSTLDQNNLRLLTRYR